MSHTEIHWGSRIAKAHAVLNEAIEQYSPSQVFGLFSGGHDSLASTSIVAKHPRFTAAVHINTGIGIEETRKFVRSTCKEQGWPLIELRAKEDCGQDYRELVLEYGFPGPGHHYKMYGRLKERCLELLLRTRKRHRRDRLVFTSGCRSQESSRRMGHVEPIQNIKRSPCVVWVAPIHDWSKSDCVEYIESEGLPQNQVVRYMHMSGECLCGAYAHPGELAEIEMWYPKTAAKIKALEKEVRQRGHDRGWEERPTPRRKASSRIPAQSLCTRCVHDEEQRGEQ